MLYLPGDVRDRILTIYGPAGQAWLDELPASVTRLEREWDFIAGPALANLSYAYVAEVMLGGGTPAVLKAQPPHPESKSELAALRAWDGRGAVRLLREDPDGGFALLERLEPGVTLEEVDDDTATAVLGEVMLPLFVAPPNDPALITLERWGEDLFAYPAAYRSAGPLPAELVADAIHTYRALLDSSPRPRLLHGDLHHGNVLAATRAPWLAIDPKGVIGDPAFEPSALFFNPLARVAREPGIPALIERRLAIVCDTTGLDRQRVAAWGFARAMLSLCWSASSRSPVREHVVAVARALRAQL